MNTLFDAAESERLKNQGIAQVASFPNDEWVAKARAIAINFAAKNGEVCADDVRKIFTEQPPHPNCWGAVFQTPRLRWLGRMNVSASVSRKSGLQRVWEHVAEAKP